MLSQALGSSSGLPGPSRRCTTGALHSGRAQHAAAAARLQRARRGRPFVASPPSAAPWGADDDGATASAAAFSGPSGDGCSTSSSSSSHSSSSSSPVGGAWGPSARALAAAAAAPAARGRAAAARAGKGAGPPGGGKDGGGSPPNKPGGGKSSGSGGKRGKGSADDKADPNKADFSAYWSLRFREFFSGRRQYLELARKRQEPPEIVQKVDAQIAEQARRLDEATQAKRDHARERYLAEVMAEARAVAEIADPSPADLEAAASSLPTDRDRMQADLDAARAALQSPVTKAAAIAPLQLRAAARAAVAAPLAVPAALLARWRGLFADRRYEAFLLSEGERVWYWRNRTENERWFWEVFAFDRFLVPAAWILGYLYLVPDNLIWAVIVPFVVLFWQDGRLPSPRNMEWWLIMIFGFYGKCWHQVVGLLSLVLRWW